MPLTLIQNDIIRMDVDAIVNAANVDLKMGGGVCGDIFKAAGEKNLQTACNKLAPIKTGEAVITPGFNLSAKYIIHTAGPIYCDGMHGEEQLLRNSYINSLKCATENGLGSIAFPLISSGIYGYPEMEALVVALSAIRNYINEYNMNVYLVILNEMLFKKAISLGGMK